MYWICRANVSSAWSIAHCKISSIPIARAYIHTCRSSIASIHDEQGATDKSNPETMGVFRYRGKGVSSPKKRQEGDMDRRLGGLVHLFL